MSTRQSGVRAKSITLALVGLIAVSCSAAPAAPAAPAANGTPVSTAAPASVATPTAAPSVAPTPSPTIAPTQAATAAALTDPLCDPYLTAAEVAAVSGPVTRIQGSEHQGLENQNATDLLCVYTLATNQLVRFQVAHELVNGTKADGSEMDPAEIDKVKHAGGTPVAGLGIVAFSVVVNGTAVVVWQVSKQGTNTIEDELDGPTLADLLVIAKLVRTPG